MYQIESRRPAKFKHSTLPRQFSFNKYALPRWFSFHLSIQTNTSKPIIQVIISNSLIQRALYILRHNTSRLVGIKYIVTGDVFPSLPMEERKLCVAIREK
jgi:hypothetical protein